MTLAESTPKIPTTCKWGWHDFAGCEPRKVTYPKRGPFDPRDDEDRTETFDVRVCVNCGKEKRIWPDPYPGY